jgi:WD40 repeat protein
MRIFRQKCYCRRKALKRNRLITFLAVCVALSLPYITKAQTPDLIVETGHTSSVLSGTFSADGKTFASVSGFFPSTISLWDVASGRELRAFKGHTYTEAIAFSPNGKTLACGFIDGTINLWDGATGHILRTLNGHTSKILSVKFSPDGSLLASGGLDKTVKLWDVASGIELRTLRGHTDQVTSIAFSPDGKSLATSGAFEDKTIKLWSVVTGQELMTLSSYPAGVWTVAFSPDGQTLLSAIGDTVNLWNIATRQEIRTSFGHSDTEGVVAFSPDGKTRASGRGTVKIQDVVTGEILRTLFTGTSFLVFSPDSKTLATGTDTITRLWDVASGQQLKILPGYGNSISLVVSSIDGKTLASEGEHNTINLWNLASGQPLMSLVGHTAKVRALAFSPDGKILASGSQDDTVKLWDVASGQELNTLKGHVAWVLGVNFSPDGKMLASESGYRAIELFDVNGKYVGVRNGTGTIKLWDVASGKEIISFEGKYPAGFSPDSKMYASRSGAFDENLKLIDVATGQELSVLNSNASLISSMAFSPDGRTLATSGDNNDKSVKLWDITTGRGIKTLPGQTNGVVYMVFSPDGKTLISGSQDGSVKVWDVVSGKELSFFPTFDSNAAREILAIAPDCYRSPFLLGVPGRMEIEDDRISLYAVKTGRLVASLVALDKTDWVVITPEGRFDTSRLENPQGLHWLAADAPFTPLSFEIFMRDYFEPRLLPRLLKCTETGNCDQEFKPVRELSSLNRTQPLVKITKVASGTSPETLEVSVEMDDVVSDYQKDAGGKQTSSGVFDLRLFRDGQLVGYSTSDEKLQTTFRTYKDFDEELGVWRQANKIDLVNGKKTFTFTVKLPANQTTTSLGSATSFNSAGLLNKEVEFSAYAFNEDRVKSNTATSRWTLSDEAAKSRTEPQRVKPRAYVIAVGVNANENPAFNLQFAANDARRFQEALSSRLTATNEYSEVVPVSLISDWEDRSGQKVTTLRGATKANFKAVIDLLAGRQVSNELKRAIPNAAKLLKSTPDDLVMILFSSHGYADRNGAFYFIPYDTGPGACKIFTETVRQRSISSDELSLWLRDVDAGQMTLIVDACYSTAAIEGSGFKPGPMGSRGLGQLAYDKRMRILTATQADNVAMELTATADGRAIKHGLLSYALLENGLDTGDADFKPLDKNIFMAEWLEFGVADVPKLFALIPKPAGGVLPLESQAAAVGRAKSARLVMQRELADTGACAPINRSQPSRSQEQQPALFDFTRRGRDVLIMRKN